MAWTLIRHLSLYIILLLCFFSKRALLGKGDPHRKLGGFIQSGSSWYPGVGRTTRFFTKKKRAVKPILKKNGLLLLFLVKKRAAVSEADSPFFFCKKPG